LRRSGGVAGWFGKRAAGTFGGEIAAQARGLEVAFTLMLIPLGGAGVLLIAKQCFYAVDVAAADRFERRGGEHIVKPLGS
jgi:hypothetical protein